MQMVIACNRAVLNDRRNIMDVFEKAISDFTKLKAHEAAAYYRYSMKIYWEFMSKKYYI